MSKPTANEIGVRREVVDYKRSTKTKSAGTDKVGKLFYVYELKLECGHSITREKSDPGAPQYAFCCECKKDEHKKRTRTTLTARYA